MCTVVIARRPNSPWPLLLAANRDELADRACLPPGRHWDDRPDVTGGLDLLGGGSWLGLNDNGVLAAVLNRRGTLGPEPGRRSRGELVLEALEHADAEIAAEMLISLDPAAWRPFNLVVADSSTAWWLRHGGDGAIRAAAIPEGVSLLDSGELNDPHSPRIARYLQPFRDNMPDLGTEAHDDDWTSIDHWSFWPGLLADRGPSSTDPREAMCVVTDGPYGTRSSSLIALPRFAGERAVWLHADGRPGEAPFLPVEL
jgi:uncharacterized protein with NRDE domain